MKKQLPTTPTRRRFLSQAAGVAAGGAVLELATVSATAGAAAPMAAVASSGVDPIFARIEEYRTAAKAHAAAAAEYCSHEDTLIDRGLGLSPFISVLEMRSGPGRAKPVMVYKREYVDIHIPPDRFSELNAAAHAELDAKIEQHKAIVGDSEKILYAAQDAEIEALDELVWTQPTTIAGVLALLELWPELQGSRTMDHDQTNGLIISVVDALQNIHPEAGAAGSIPVVLAPCAGRG
jgi:hypothetical protein